MPLISRQSHIAIYIHCLWRALCTFMLCSWKAARLNIFSFQLSSDLLCYCFLLISCLLLDSFCGGQHLSNLASSGELRLDILLGHLHGNTSSILRGDFERFLGGSQRCLPLPVGWTSEEKPSFQSVVKRLVLFSIPMLVSHCASKTCVQGCI